MVPSCFCSLFFLMIRRPPRSTLFPTRRSSDLLENRGRRDPSHLFTACGFSRSICRARPVSAVGDGLRLTSSVSRAHSRDRKSTRLNSSHVEISYAVFCLKKKKNNHIVDVIIVH